MITDIIMHTWYIDSSIRQFENKALVIQAFTVIRISNISQTAQATDHAYPLWEWNIEIGKRKSKIHHHFELASSQLYSDFKVIDVYFQIHTSIDWR